MTGNITIFLTCHTHGFRASKYRFLKDADSFGILILVREKNAASFSRRYADHSCRAVSFSSGLAPSEISSLTRPTMM